VQRETTAAGQLLATKLLVPRRVPTLIDRPRLSDLSAEIPAKQLTMIRAAAGFGKTSLAVAWAEQLQQTGKSVAWFTLDAHDDEPTRFFYYLCHALRHASADVGDTAINLTSDVSLVSSHTIATALLNDLVSAEDVYLFLDDYHWIKNAEIQEALAYVLNYAPAQFHLVITSRTESGLPLARLRAQDQLLEIDTSALRFDLEETRQFVEHDKLGMQSLADIKMLHAKTEGWPAVLRLVVSTCLQSGQDFGRYVRSLSGGLRPVGDYLSDMLRGAPDDMVRFMLRTAILDRLSSDLCEAVSGSDEAGDMLDAIESRQLLLAPLDAEGRWYRYHPLLAEYLGQELKAKLPDEIPELHRRAYRWYARYELWKDAVQHAIAAGDSDQAVSWIENCAMALVKKGDLLTLLEWERRFPAELMRSRINVKVAIAWGMSLAMRFEESLKLLEEIEGNLDADSQDSEALVCECLSIRSVIRALQDDSQGALPLAESCLSRVKDPWTANVASNVARFGYWKSGELVSFYAVPWIPYSLEEERRSVFSSVYLLCLQGLSEVQQLHFPFAERCYLDAIRLAEEHVGQSSVVWALPASLIAQLWYERGRVDEAEALIIDRVPIINATGMLECVLSTYFVLERVAARYGNIERAYALLDQAENLAYSRQWGRLSAFALMERMHVYLDEGRIIESGACLDRLDRLSAEYLAPTRCAWSDIAYYTELARARLASAQNRQQDAIAILTTLQQEAEAAENNYFAVHVSVRLSKALLAANEHDQAEKVFRQVISVAAPAGIYQTILDQGPEIGALLFRFDEKARAGDAGGALAHVRSLISSWGQHYQPDKTGPKRLLVDSLSRRERSILELIGQGRSNKEIARSLGITPETVKSHVKSIFAKLGVERRAQAIWRAHSLGIIGASGN
jgi:LuxR family transcriptional regulator, maltose regulon positive regulatory protein